MKVYESMTVPELREEAKQRGLPLSANNKKFTKAELIQMLKENDPDDKMREKPERREGNKGLKNERFFATNFSQIVQKYSKRKPASFYERLEVGNIVVFIHHVEAKDGHIYKKLRTAKITKNNPEKEVIEVQLLFGNVLNLTYDDILYSKKENEYFPPDIRMYLRYKRSKVGERMVTDRFRGGVHE